VEERDENREQIHMTSPDGKFRLLGESDGITITEINTEPTAAGYSRSARNPDP
jgi:hypothetical protein